MANYGAQFEALMSEVCRDFGYKLVKSWELDRGAPLDKAEIRNFVEEAVKNFFLFTEAREEGEPAPAPAPAKSKAPAVVVKSTGKGGKGGKGKAPAKPKCQALTAKGTPCSKCALEGSAFCSVHDPSKKKKASSSAEDEAETSSKASASASASVAASKNKKGKAPAKPAKKNGKGGGAVSDVPASAKHTHGLDEIDYENCDLCKSHGAPFELPDYEPGLLEDETADAAGANAAVATATGGGNDEAEIDYDPYEDPEEIDPDDPDYVVGGSLSEEDFDEDDD
jgi:hypothetical protein